MAEKDIAEKILEAYNEVFADIVNVLLFHGKEVVKPDELVEQAPRAAYKADGILREIERDVAKRWTKQNIHIACLGLENQTKADRDMPLRVIGYDGAEYRWQLSQDFPERYPVATLVLYFDYEKHWNGPLNLLDCFHVPEEFTPYVNDYKVNLFEIAYLSEEQVKLFKSDFRVVAEYFTQMQRNRDYKPEPWTLVHVQEVLQLLSIMTGDHRFEEVFASGTEGGPENMCEVLDRIESRGEARGIDTMAKAMAKTMRDMGMTEEQIAEAVRISKEKVGQNVRSVGAD